MPVTILGCGEAFDHRYPNTSILLRAPQGTILFDCGYSIPPRVWAESPDPNEIDAVYISHPHADHYFGLPALFGRMWEEGRTKPLIVASQAPVLEQIRTIMELGYRSLSSRFKYEVEYRPVEAGEPAELCGMPVRFAQTQHSVTNYAIRVDLGGRVVCYSGDGMFTPESSQLFLSADLLVHEAFWFEPSPVHADIGALIRMAEEQRVRRLALVHVQRTLRSRPQPIIDAMESAAGVEVSMPEPGATFDF